MIDLHASSGLNAHVQINSRNYFPDINSRDIADEAKSNEFYPIPLKLGKAPNENYFNKNRADAYDDIRKSQGYNIGILTGSKSKVIVIDIDVHNNGM